MRAEYANLIRLQHACGIAVGKIQGMISGQCGATETKIISRYASQYVRRERKEETIKNEKRE